MLINKILSKKKKSHISIGLHQWRVVIVAKRAQLSESKLAELMQVNLCKTITKQFLEAFRHSRERKNVKFITSTER